MSHHEKLVPSQCGNCRFWLSTPDQGPDDGVCRRYPPVVIGNVRTEELKGYAVTAPVVVTTTHTAFPQMRQVGWCGEYSAKVGSSQH